MHLNISKLGLVGCCAAGLFAQSIASPIDYVFKGLATGQVGNTQFTEAGYTIIVHGDTSNITHPFATVFQNDGAATFSLQDGPSGSFLGETGVFDAQDSGGLIGFSATDNTNATNDVIQLWDTSIPSTFFASYALGTATPLIGPAPNPSISDFVNIQTDQGLMSISWMAENTFQASPVPEPTSVAVIGLGIAAVIKRRKR